MIYALDTMIVSEPRKPRPHGAVLSWIAAHPLSAYAIPSVVFFELQRGVEMTRRQDQSKATELDTWIENVMKNTTVLPFTPDVARETARLLGHYLPGLFIDAAIAATARVYSLTVATRNTRDFKRFDVPLVNPFLYGQ